jgi:hypothetical protein
VEASALLLVGVQREAQTRRIDPLPAHLGQPPYGSILGEGVCDLRQRSRLAIWVKQLSARHEDQEHASLDGIAGEVLLGNLVLALASTTIDDENPVRSGEATHPPTEPIGHAHEDERCRGLLRAHEPSPPLAEATTRVAQPEVRVQDNAIDAA